MAWNGTAWKQRGRGGGAHGDVDAEEPRVVVVGVERHVAVHQVVQGALLRELAGHIGACARHALGVSMRRHQIQDDP